MATGIAALQRFQIGYESTPGTAVAATRRLYGKGRLTYADVIHAPEDEERASLAARHRSVLAGKMANWSFEGDAAYEDLIDLLSIAVKGDVTPVQQAATAGYLWTFTPSLTSTPSLKTATLEAGDNNQCYEAEYGMMTDLEISGSVDSVLRVRANGYARQLTATTFTAVADHTINEVVADVGTFALDAASGDLGDTAQTGTLIDFSARIATGCRPAKRQSGQLYFSTVGFEKHSLEISATLEFNSNAVSVIALLESQETQFARFNWPGPLISGAVFNDLKIDAALRITEVAELGESDGITTVRVTGKSFYDSTYAKDFEIAVVAARNTL